MVACGSESRSGDSLSPQQDDSLSPQQIEYQAGVSIAQGRLAGTDDTALWVNGYAVSSAEVLELRAKYKVRLDELHADRFITKHHIRLRDIMDQHGHDAVTLLGIAMRYSDYSAAVEAGYRFDRVWEAVEFSRALYEEKSDEPPITLEVRDYATGKPYTVTFPAGLMPEYVGYVETLGETYWRDVLPAEMERGGVVDQWRYDGILDTEGRDPEFRRKALLAFQREAFSDVEIVLAEPFVLDTDIDAMYAYMEVFRAYEDTNILLAGN